MNTKKCIPLILTSALLCSPFASGATLGSDNASATAYDGGWTDGTDGSITGPGAFGQWFLNADTTDIVHEVTSVSSLSSNAPNLDTGGRSFRMLGRQVGGDPNEATAFRFIDPAGLSVGQTFSIDIAVNFRNGFKGIDLRSSAVGDPTIFNFNIGGDDYVVNNAATGNGSIGNTYSDDTLFNVAFEQTSAGGGTWSITRSGGVTDFDTGTYTGVARSIKLYAGGTDGNNQDALFANNLLTVPEPAQVAFMLGFAALIGVSVRKYRVRH
ncbi:hypothetical protein [Rubellicoccus peritrichatus]|uniref:PEP-CTERM protein-sorting domain-containing protein n=1 Tax=Rubellicoccus peritrichatus TaxID=3080537 RepID=A0AAQ3LDC2_9BACT|nr:hypothetical protein [Puniceicoccus sp. CR14]WOO41785.1 hypothetical protein RZN69_01700 [Puniceicoccus sp. CR14]